MAASGTCGGCMDSDSILDVIGSSGFGNLTARYPGGGDCDTWVTEM